MNIAMWTGSVIAAIAAVLFGLTWFSFGDDAGQAMPIGSIAMFFELVMLGVGLSIVAIGAAAHYL